MTAFAWIVTAAGYPDSGELTMGMGPCCGSKKRKKKKTKGEKKIAKTMTEFGKGKLRSGSKHGPKVTNKKQAIAIALNQARKAGAK